MDLAVSDVCVDARVVAVRHARPSWLWADEPIASSGTQVIPNKRLDHFDSGSPRYLLASRAAEPCDEDKQRLSDTVTPLSALVDASVGARMH